MTSDKKNKQPTNKIKRLEALPWMKSPRVVSSVSLTPCKTKFHKDGWFLTHEGDVAKSWFENKGKAWEMSAVDFNNQLTLVSYCPVDSDKVTAMRVLVHHKIAGHQQIQSTLRKNDTYRELRHLRLLSAKSAKRLHVKMAKLRGVD